MAKRTTVGIICLLLLVLLLISCSEQAAEKTEVAPPAATEVPAGESTETEPTAPQPAPEVETSPGTPGVPTVDFDNLHVPSPEWEDQIIYFLMTDRFYDGDPSNSDQGANEYDPADFRKYSGGDLQGVINQLDYIQGLGATAIWITPPVSNQWWDPLVEFGGYHGYWAENFMDVDPHLGTLETYQALSDALHERGMYLIQDIVANHTGNFFTYRDEEGRTNYNPSDPAANVALNEETVPVSAPSQPPFDQNNVADPAHQEAAIYHWTPAIEDFQDEEQLLTFQLSDLDDLNTENPAVSQALRQSYAHWIELVGVDGFRIDTVLYVEHDFWHDFEYAEDPEAPGMTAAASKTGRDDFLTFGEAFVDAEPLDDGGDRRVATYMGTAEKPELDAVLNFPMHFTINRVFAEGQPTSYMTYRLDVAQDPSIYPNPNILPNFIDNHDVARFLAKGNVDGLKQAIMFIMTTPGIPVIYYGTEQGFTESRAAMFAEGWGSEGQDHFDQDAELYQYIAGLAELRKANPFFTRGTLTTLAGNEVGPGPLAFRRDHEGQSALVIFNTSDRPVLLTDMDTGLPAGTVLTNLLGLVDGEDLVVGRDGRMTMELAVREGLVLLASDEVVEVETGETATVTIETDLAGRAFDEDFEIAGTVSEPDTAVKIIINGNLSQAIDATADEDGGYAGTVPISIFPPGQASNTVTVYAPALLVASETMPFTTEVTSTTSNVTVYDLQGDDVGPLHTYRYPTDETFGRQMDILNTRASALGTNLQVEVEMAEVTTVWNPPNGFDHALFHIFVDLADGEGETVLPRINAQAPEGFAWDFEAFSEGWNNRLHSAEGATADAYGRAVTPAPEISVDKANNKITFLFTSDALGNPDTLEGARVYVSVWDWTGPDATYRPLRPGGGQWAFGGGDGSAGDPLIIEETDVIPVTLDTRRITFDPAGDDEGPYDPATASGRYTLPTDTSFGQQMDLRQITLLPGDEALTVSLNMGQVTDDLDSPNGFDHVRFHIFFDVPEQEGATVLPFLNAKVPDGFDWDYQAVLDGWHNEFYTAGGAAADANGSPVALAPDIAVNQEASTIDVAIPAAALGSPENLAGVNVYVATWDWDDENEALRALTADGGPFEFGGGDGASDPLIVDDALVGLPGPYRSPIPPTPQVRVAFTVSVPESTPAGDNLYLTGPFNEWDPADELLKFAPQDDGTYKLIVAYDEGAFLKYRITRGSFANAEKFDPEDRFANRELEVPVGQEALEVELEIEGWWDE